MPAIYLSRALCFLTIYPRISKGRQTCTQSSNGHSLPNAEVLGTGSKCFSCRSDHGQQKVASQPRHIFTFEQSGLHLVSISTCSQDEPERLVRTSFSKQHGATYAKADGQMLTLTEERLRARNRASFLQPFTKGGEIEELLMRTSLPVLEEGNQQRGRTSTLSWE